MWGEDHISLNVKAQDQLLEVCRWGWCGREIVLAVLLVAYRLSGMEVGSSKHTVADRRMLPVSLERFMAEV